MLCWRCSSSVHELATTETVRQCSAAGKLDDGSTMWCMRCPPRLQRRTDVPDVVRPPAVIVTVWPGASIGAR